MSTIDPETKRKGIETAVKLGIIGVGCAIVGPFAYMALEGLIAVAAFAGAAILLWGIAPAVATFVANKRIALLVAAIEANPIETMQNLLIEKTAEFQKQEDAVTEFDTQFRNVQTLVKDLTKTDPDEAVQYQEMADQMEQGLSELRSEQAAAQAELKNARGAIDKMQRIWKVACAMNKALAASADAQAQVFAKMKNDVAIDTVRTNLNRAFARLNTAVERRKNGSMLPTPKIVEVKALPEATPTSPVIDLGKVGSRVSLR